RESCYRPGVDCHYYLPSLYFEACCALHRFVAHQRQVYSLDWLSRWRQSWHIPPILPFRLPDFDNGSTTLSIGTGRTRCNCFASRTTSIPSRLRCATCCTMKGLIRLLRGRRSFNE